MGLAIGPARPSQLVGQIALTVVPERLPYSIGGCWQAGYDGSHRPRFKTAAAHRPAACEGEPRGPSYDRFGVAGCLPLPRRGGHAVAYPSRFSLGYIAMSHP